MQRRAVRTMALTLCPVMLAVACGAPAAAPSSIPPVVFAPSASGSSLPAPPAPASPSASPASTPPAQPQAELPPAQPVLTPALYALRAKAQRRVLGNAPLIEDEQGKVVPFTPIPNDAAGNPVWVNGNSLGRFVAIENEQALAHFHKALRELATGKDADGKLRVAIYGASHTQGDLYTGYLRYYLQSRFGNGGAGFMQLARLNQFYRTLDFKMDSKGFRVEHAQKKEPLPDGRYGLFGAAAIGRFPYAYASLEPANRSDPEIQADRYTLFYDAEPGGGDLKLSVDAKPLVKLVGSAEKPEARYYPFETALGWHSLQVKPAGNGPVRLFGVAIERSTPGIVLDSMGINGTRAANLLRWDVELWRQHLLTRAPDLFVLAYGTNEATDTGEPIEVYAKNLALVLTRLRAVLPHASCLLVGPGDFPFGQGPVTRPRVVEINARQREISAQFNCGFWDTFAFMGRQGSMHAWANAKPALGSPDHIHFTARGYVRMGMALGDALLRAYDEQEQKAELPLALRSH